MADGIALLDGAFRMPRPLLVSNFCLSMYCQSFTMMYWSECCRGATVECKTRAMPQLEIRRAIYDGTGQTRIGVDDLRARILRDHERIELPLSGLGVHGFYLRLNVDVIFESSIVVLLCVQNEGDQPLIASPIASRMMSTTRSGRSDDWRVVYWMRPHSGVHPLRHKAPRQPEVPIQSAMAFPISSGESS
jgi:hypothetical protein